MKTWMIALLVALSLYAENPIDIQRQLRRPCPSSLVSCHEPREESSTGMPAEPASNSIDPPHLISFSLGIFDVMRERHRTLEFSMEFKGRPGLLRSPFRFLDIRPLFGIMATIRGTTYLYGGINFDLFPSNHLLIAPGFAAGWYRPGEGKNLGYPLEFRTGVELAWQFNDSRRIGIHFYHLSNAGLGNRNPGEESIVLFYDIPLKKGFPFN